MARVVLAYSGGLDTSVAIRWLQEQYGLEVVTLTIGLGGDVDLESTRARALEVGAVEAYGVDGVEELARDFITPALKADALYERVYPLATALARPLIAEHLVRTARTTGATLIAHGCTGKGNDQVRFDVATAALATDLKVIAPIREWKMSREEEINYAAKHGISIDVTHESPYSTDENIWGRSIEAGPLEDPAVPPPEDAYTWTTAPQDAPNEAQSLVIDFEAGVPVALDGNALPMSKLIESLNGTGGRHGVGRIDMLENRLVGLKSREIYEAPAAVILHRAHRAIEDLTQPKDSARFGEIVSQTYADLVYNGLWYSALRRDLAAFVESEQRHVSGQVRLRLFKGAVTVIGRTSPFSLYDEHLATYGRDDEYNYDAAEGFISLWGLPLRTQARVQNLTTSDDPATGN